MEKVALERTGFEVFILEVLPELAVIGGSGESTSQCCASGTRD